MWALTAQGLQSLSVAALWVATISGGIAVAAGFLSTITANHAGDLVQSDADRRIAEAEARGREALAHAAEAEAKGKDALAHAADANVEVARANEGLAVANSKIASANERAAALEKKAADAKLATERLREQIAPRRLAPEALADISAALKPFSGKKVFLESYTLDVESALLGGQIMDALQKAGIGVEDMRLTNTPLQSVFTGVRIFGSDSVFVGSMLATFAKEGHLAVSLEPPLSGAGSSMGDGGASADANIFVGTKPIKE
ncbi:MAG: hypothetical protein ABIM50_05390 [Novosphingobium sp.]